MTVNVPWHTAETCCNTQQQAGANVSAAAAAAAVGLTVPIPLDFGLLHSLHCSFQAESVAALHHCRCQ